MNSWIISLTKLKYSVLSHVPFGSMQIFKLLTSLHFKITLFKSSSIGAIFQSKDLYKPTRKKTVIRIKLGFPPCSVYFVALKKHLLYVVSQQYF